MATPDEVASIIRYGLSQLSARDAHHEFEHLCRQLTRRRICSNILPATGPVSAGGDQGRDFETFRTYLIGESPELSSFIGLAASETIVFTCTLQKDDVQGKIKSDVRSIVSQGTAVDRVYAFCEANVPVAIRHRVQAEVLEQHGVSLEVIDGTGIAEMLADPDVFWIAQRHLALPSEVLPDLPSDERAAWYRESFERWRDASPVAFSYGELSELQRSMRHAIFGAGPKGDIPFWMDRIEQFEAQGESLALRRRATYETLVAWLRGLGTLEGQEDRIASYFDSTSILSGEGERDIVKSCGTGHDQAAV